MTIRLDPRYILQGTYQDCGHEFCFAVREVIYECLTVPLVSALFSEAYNPMLTPISFAKVKVQVGLLTRLTAEL